MKKRQTQPKNNAYYIRKLSDGLNGAVAGSPTIKGANVLCNCVGYANGRFNEIINDPDLKGVKKAFKYQLVCNAENFIERAKNYGLTISKVPTVGGIMVWQKGQTLSGGDGAGHVAVVEEIYTDGTILTSESGWGAWAFKTVRRSNSNGRWGQSSAYKFRGCIVNPSVGNKKAVPVPSLTVDGVGGANTVRAMQKFFGTPQDGVISGQSKTLNKYYPALKAVEYGTGGSACIKKLQKWVGVTADGVLGQKTVKAWQKKIGVKVDGIFGTESMRVWQKYLNDHPKDKTETKEPASDKVYKVIDVSVWQGKIDWLKVKADGVVGAIIRYADGHYLDKNFDANMTGAKKAGLHVGAYIFSRAKTKAEAESEAASLFNACKPYDPDMPLYIDLEDSSLSKYADTVAIAFLNKMTQLGGRGGVYANLNWWNNYLTKTAKEYSAHPFWIAQYNSKITHSNPKLFGMWQYSSSGSVNGISGKVDMDRCYTAYWDMPKVKTNSKLVDKAVALAWPKGTAESKYAWKGGKPTDAFKKALDAVYPKRDSWGTAAKAGCACDVFVGVCVRSVLDGNFPRGFRDQYTYTSNKLEKHTYKNVKPYDVSKDGDIVGYYKDAKREHCHIVIRGNGMIYEAQHEMTYAHVNTSLSKLKTVMPEVVVFRPK